MNATRDFTGRWRCAGFESIDFSSEADAKAAADLAIEFARSEIGKESRYRRAANRAKEATEVGA